MVFVVHGRLPVASASVVPTSASVSPRRAQGCRLKFGGPQRYVFEVYDTVALFGIWNNDLGTWTPKVCKGMAFWPTFGGL